MIARPDLTVVFRKMKAEINPKETCKRLALITKGIKGEKARSKAMELIRFKKGSIDIESDEMSATCPAKRVTEGVCALNPLILKEILETCSEEKIIWKIDETRVQIGRLKSDPRRLNVFLEYPEIAIRLWKLFKEKQLSKKINREAKEREWHEEWKKWVISQREALQKGRIVDFKRVDGGVEREAVILGFERGEGRDRRVLVKTKDFQEVWINELEIVEFDPGDKLGI